ncbi:MAG: YfiR family protein [Bryobacterales bacterium]
MAFAALALALSLARPANAQPSNRGAVGEYQVKAAFLYHFAKFVEWPASAKNGQTIEVCVLGSDPFGPALDFLLEDKTLQGKRFDVRRVNGTAEGQSCHVLFVAFEDKHELQSVVQTLSGSPVLTVGDSPDFSRAGGMIYLFVDESKVRFDINLAAAKHSGITISAALLRLARKVESK